MVSRGGPSNQDWINKRISKELENKLENHTDKHYICTNKSAECYAYIWWPL